MVPNFLDFRFTYEKKHRLKQQTQLLFLTVAHDFPEWTVINWARWIDEVDGLARICRGGGGGGESDDRFPLNRFSRTRNKNFPYFKYLTFVDALLNFFTYIPACISCIKLEILCMYSSVCHVGFSMYRDGWM